MKLRSKFLLSVIVVLLVLTSATLTVVKVICQKKVREIVLSNLNSSLLAFKTFEMQVQSQAKHASELMAFQPSLRALMTTHDRRTIQDGSIELRTLLGADLLLLLDRDGKVMALHSDSSQPDLGTAQQWVDQHFSIRTDRNPKWWLVAGRLLEVFCQPIYSGPPSDKHFLGILTVGYKIDHRMAEDIGKIAASQVAFEYNNEIAASSFEAGTSVKPDLIAQDGSATSEVNIGTKRFLLDSVPLSETANVRLVVFKSLDDASHFIQVTNQILFALGISAVVVGCILVFFISRRFTRPLEALISGVYALEQQEFNYPLDCSGNDEFATLTCAFNQMRTALQNTQKKLIQEARLATVGRMASSISHDLRHQLTAIMGYTEFLGFEGLSQQKRREFSDQINSAVASMTDLLESMVELSRSSQSLRVEHVPLLSVVARARSAVARDPRYQQIAIEIDCHENIRGWFDPRKLEQALFNLLLNACEVVPKESPRVQIMAVQNGENIEISVTDNGPGIPHSIRNNLFEPFVSYGKQNGSGLGLAIVQKCCHDHGGQAYLEISGPGYTAFRIVLPAKPVQEDPIRRTSKPGEAMPASTRKQDAALNGRSLDNIPSSDVA